MNAGGSDALETFVPLVFKRRGIQRLAETGTPAHDTTIIEAVGRALYWQQLLDTGAFVSGAAIARAERLHRTTVNKLLRLPLLAPDIIARLMAGRQETNREQREKIVRSDAPNGGFSRVTLKREHTRDPANTGAMGKKNPNR